MKTFQYIGLLVAAGAGCFLGTYAANDSPTIAHAQDRGDFVQTIDILYVPDGGLRMVTEEGRLIGLIDHVNGAGRITLSNERGVPGAVFAASVESDIEVSGNVGGMRVTSSDGETLLVSILKGGQIEYSDEGSGGFSLNASRGIGALSLSNAKGRATLQASAGTDGATLALQSAEGVTLLEALIEKAGGTLRLKDPTGKSGVTLTAAPSAVIRSQGSTIWQMPAK